MRQTAVWRRDHHGRPYLEVGYEDRGAGRARSVSVGPRPVSSGSDEDGGRREQRIANASSPVALAPANWISPFDQSPPASFALLDAQGIALRIVQPAGASARALARARAEAHAAATALAAHYGPIDLVGLDRQGRIVWSRRLNDAEDWEAA